MTPRKSPYQMGDFTRLRSLVSDALLAYGRRCAMYSDDSLYNLEFHKVMEAVDEHALACLKNGLSQLRYDLCERKETPNV